MNQYRPLRHITPKQGWINDPNGFCYFNDEYHLYTQHYPFDTKWGPMRWLHFVSTDLINWKEVGISLEPDQDYDKEYGCFSGSAVVKDNKLHVIYTGSVTDKQTQCLAVSTDGHSFTKYEGNPLIDESLLIEGYLVKDFRDPKIFVINGIYYLLVACRHKENYSSILLFRSDDLLHFKFVNVVLSLHNLLDGGMVECPDIIFEGDKCALLYSIQKPIKEADKFHNHFTVAYRIGSFDVKKELFTLGEEQELDKGFDCYATQTLAKDNKNYIVYWMSSWGINYPTSVEGYAGQLSLVKQLNIVDDHLVMSFLKGEDTKEVSLTLIKNKGVIKLGNIKIIFDKKKKMVTLIRGHMDHKIIYEKKEKLDRCYFYLSSLDNIHLEYSVDNSCVEISFNHGEVFTSLLNLKKKSDYQLKYSKHSFR